MPLAVSFRYRMSLTGGWTVLVDALWLLSGLAGGVALCMGVSAITTRDRAAAFFCVISAGLAAYVGLQASVYVTVDVPAAAVLLRFQGVATAATLLVLPWFGAAFVERREGRFGWIISAGYLLLGIWSLASPAGYWFRSLDRLDPVVLSWGETIRVPRGDISWGYVFSWMLQYPLYVRLLLRVPGLYRDRRLVDAWVWGIALTLLIASAVHDHGVDLGLWPGQYLGEWVFLAMLAVMGLRMGVLAGGRYRGHLRAEEALRQREARLRHIHDSIAEGIAFSHEGRLLDVNVQLASMLGYTAEEMVGRVITDFVAPESRDTVAEALHSSAPTHYEHLALRKDGSTFPVETTARSAEFEGRPARVTVLRDLTDRRRAEQALRTSEAQLSNALRMAHAGHWEYDVASDTFTFNDNFYRIFRTTAEEVGGYTMSSAEYARRFCHPDDLHLVAQETQAAIEAADPDYSRQLVHRILFADGEVGHIAVRFFIVKDAQGRTVTTYGVNQDITAVKRTEEALRESEANFRTLAETAASGIFVFHRPTRRLRFVNPAMERLTGYDEGELLALNYMTLLHPDDRWMVLARDDARSRGEAISSRLEFRVLTKQGEIRWVDFAVGDIQFGGEPANLGTVFDITERKRAQSELTRLAAAIEQAAETIVVTDTQGQIVYANPAIERTSGYSREEVLGKNPRILKSGRHDADFYRQMWDALTRGDVWHGHLVNRRKDGSIYEEDATISPVRTASGETTNYVAIKLDVTRAREMEDQMQQARKMEAIGQLAGGVAHDFNNLLQAMLGNAELVLEKTPAADARYAELMEILHAGRRAADLTRQLLAFARKQTVQPQVLDLNELVEGTLKLLRRLIGENIELVWKPQHGVWPVMIDPSQMDQILANLTVNARDAIQGVGRVGISVKNAVVGRTFSARCADATPGEYVVLAVSDNGSGIDKDILGRIFEPFFTTKGLGHGTGMGLATVFGIVKQNNGFIDVASEPGRGTTFDIYLPRHAELPSTGAPGPTARPELPRGRGQTVMFVEDEAAILAIATRMLERLGYVPVGASSPTEAISTAERHEGPIDLLITDVILPEMTGRELAGRIRAARPEAKLLFVSGYASDVIGRHGVLEDEVEFLQKPFSLEALATKVHRILTAG